MISHWIPEATLIYITQPSTTNLSTLYIHSLTTQVRYPLFQLLGWGADVAWSPDGSRIAYSAFQENQVRRLLYVFDLKTFTVEEINTGLFDINSPSWSPDGFSLVFQGIGFSNEWNIFLYDFDTDITSLMYENPGTDGRPAWSPDGKRIVFESHFYSMSLTDVVLWDVDTHEIVSLTPGFTNSISPAWSPDGTHIAFTAVTENGTYDLFTIQADGSHLIRFPAFNGGVVDPAWSPDGKMIAFSGRGINDGGYLHVYVTPSNGEGVPRRITHKNEGYLQPHWRP